MCKQLWTSQIMSIIIGVYFLAMGVYKVNINQGGIVEICPNSLSVYILTAFNLLCCTFLFDCWPTPWLTKILSSAAPFLYTLHIFYLTICGKFERAAGHQRYIFPNSQPHPPTHTPETRTNKYENQKFAANAMSSSGIYSMQNFCKTDRGGNWSIC